MTTYEIVKEKLENFPDFRERKSRGKYLAILALRHIGLERKYEEDEPLRIDELSDFAITYDSFRHAWTDVLRENEKLQGSDYGDKTILEQAKKIELRYEVGYHQDIKKEI